MVYNNGQELFNSLESSLKTQIKDGIEKENLTLNISKDNVRVTINFPFNLKDMLKAILVEYGCLKYDGNRHICPYKINCVGVIFTNNADFDKATFTNNADFTKAIFKYDASFNGVTFKNDAIFLGTTFKDCPNFRYATFTNNAYFNEAIFENNADFTHTTFRRYAYFSRADIESKLSFDNIKLSNESHIVFEAINYIYDKNAEKWILKNPDERSEIEIEITNTVINGRIDFTNVKINEINFEGSNVMILGVLNRINFEADCANWGTASFLKHEELKKDNIIKALEYKAIEKDEYKKFIKKRRKEITEEIETLEQKNKIIVFIFKLLRIIFKPFLIIIKVFKALKIFFFGEKENDEIGNVTEKEKLKTEKNKLKAEKDKYWWEDMSIRLSRLSNNHGQNWGQAVLFTILSGAVFFAVFYAPHSWTRFFDLESWKSFFPSLFMYYIPVDFSSLKDYLGRSDLEEWLKACGVAVYIIGKITISYGYVEVVQAFRKLK